MGRVAPKVRLKPNPGVWNKYERIFKNDHTVCGRVAGRTAEPYRCEAELLDGGLLPISEPLRVDWLEAGLIMADTGAVIGRMSSDVTGASNLLLAHQ